jgi:hypothetical protein
MAILRANPERCADQGTKLGGQTGGFVQGQTLKRRLALARFFIYGEIGAPLHVKLPRLIAIIH